jgi:Flp pilus assembly protein TadD
VELFGFTNIPYGLWIDETGTIVRPRDVAFGPPRAERPATPADEEARRQQAEARRAAEERMTPEAREAMQKMTANTDRSGKYVDAVRDWVAKGADSEFVLSPAQVIEHSRERPVEFGMAAAEFELAQHLHRAGQGLDAVPHFKEAHRLDPTNWTYLRQALNVADKEWGNVYGSDMMTEVARVGAETFYLPLEM